MLGWVFLWLATHEYSAFISLLEKRRNPTGPQVPSIKSAYQKLPGLLDWNNLPEWEAGIEGNQSLEHREVIFVITIVWSDLKDCVDNTIDADL